MFFEAANLVAVAALPVTLPAIGLVTVKFANVPTLVKLEPVTVDFKVVPANVSADAAAAMVISALPSNATPLIFLGVANLVAVAALAVVDTLVVVATLVVVDEVAKSVALAINFQVVPV